MSDYPLNTWLNSTVQAYTKYFNETDSPIVWEVGSRDGHDGVELAERIYSGTNFWNDSDIVCVEANPAQAKIIKKNYPKADVLELAASNHNGKAEFMVYHGDEGAVGSSSLNLRWKEDDLEGHIIKVRTRRLEDLIDDEVDIMKIDCEGHSLEVLQGLGNKLRNVKVYHIETEKWTGTNKMVEGHMAGKGFMLVDVQEEWGGMPDMVFVRG